jgi:hypothetical protein
MSDADAKLKALFALDEPPAHDQMFVLEAARRLQARRFWIDLAGGLPWVIAASAACWALAPYFEGVSRPAATLLAYLAPGVVLAVSALVMASPRRPAVSFWRG